MMGCHDALIGRASGIVAQLEDWTVPQHWPVLELAGDYRSWRSFSMPLLTDLSAEQQAAMLGGKAQALYRL
jgi:hypothetical protein